MKSLSTDHCYQCHPDLVDTYKNSAVRQNKKEGTKVSFYLQWVGNSHPLIWSFGELCYHCKHIHVCSTRKNILKIGPIGVVEIWCRNHLFEKEHQRPILHV